MERMSLNLVNALLNLLARSKGLGILLLILSILSHVLTLQYRICRHAQDIHFQVMTGTYSRSWDNLVTEHNSFYRDLVQSDYLLATGLKQDQDCVIHGLISIRVHAMRNLLSLTSFEEALWHL